MHRSSIAILLAATLSSCVRTRTVVPDVSPAMYTSSDTAAMFAPGVISTGDVFASSFTPDGRTVYFTKTSSDRTSLQILVSHWRDGAWTAPRRAPFSTGERQMDPHVSPSGKLVYFTAPRRRSANSTDPDGDWDTWTASLEKGDPSESTRLPSLVNSPKHETYPSVTIDNTLYFGVSDRAGGAAARREIAYYHKKVRSTPVKLELPGISNPSNPYISPNGRVLIVSATGKDERTRGDLFVMTRGGDGRWSEPRNLGREVNSDAVEFCPALSPDGMYLFFSRIRYDGENITGRDIYVVPVTSVPVLRAALQSR